MPAFTLDICRFRLTFTEGAAILLVGHNAVATGMGALLYISHGLDSPERLIAQPDNPFKFRHPVSAANNTISLPQDELPP
jgi:hypothetical protein